MTHRQYGDAHQVEAVEQGRVPFELRAERTPWR